MKGFLLGKRQNTEEKQSISDKALCRGKKMTRRQSQGWSKGRNVRKRSNSVRKEAA